MFSRGKFLVIPDEGLKVLGISIDGRGVMTRKASVKANYSEPGCWMLEADGSFWEFTPAGVQNAWARIFSPIFQLVKVRFLPATPRTISVAELKSRVARIKDKQAQSLGEHLCRFRDQDTVSAEIMSSWPL
jgi:hypothetical protein